MVFNGECYVFGVGDVLLLEDIEGEGYCFCVMYNEVCYLIFVMLDEGVVL